MLLHKEKEGLEKSVLFEVTFPERTIQQAISWIIRTRILRSTPVPLETYVVCISRPILLIEDLGEIYRTNAEKSLPRDGVWQETTTCPKRYARCSFHSWVICQRAECVRAGVVCVCGGGACVVSTPSPGSAALSSGSWKECGVGIRSPELESHLQP